MWYRLVGVNLTQSGIQQDAEYAVRFITQRLNLQISFGTFVQVAAPNASVSSGDAQTSHLKLNTADTETLNPCAATSKRMILRSCILASTMRSPAVCSLHLDGVSFLKSACMFLSCRLGT